MPEVPWPTDRLMCAHLRDGPYDEHPQIKWLHFEGPDVPHSQTDYGPNYQCEGDKHQSIMVTAGDDRAAMEIVSGQNVWHYELQGETIVVSSSIHFVGHFHSGNPVTFVIDESRWW